MILLIRIRLTKMEILSIMEDIKIITLFKSDVIANNVSNEDYCWDNRNSLG